MVYLLIFYPIFSSSMYRKSSAIVIPGKTIPTSGTKIDGKYDAVIYVYKIFKSCNIYLLYKLYHIISFYISRSYL